MEILIEIKILIQILIQIEILIEILPQIEILIAILIEIEILIEILPQIKILIEISPQALMTAITSAVFDDSLSRQPSLRQSLMTVFQDSHHFGSL